MSFGTQLLIIGLSIAVGTVIGMLIDNDNTYKVTIRKIKQRGKGNTLDSNLTVNLPTQTKRERRKSERQERRNKRKE
ncbi:MAG: hypothetical protein ACXAD7_28715 [Candidatus Kariarchaeaceae archaeon]|jgi:hypothetical protein